MAVPAVIHVRKVLASACLRLHPVALEACRVSLLDGQLILAGVGLLDPLMTIGAPGALARSQLGRRKLRRSRRDWLELEVLGQRFAMLHVRKIYTEIASE